MSLMLMPLLLRMYTKYVIIIFISVLFHYIPLYIKLNSTPSAYFILFEFLFLLTRLITHVVVVFFSISYAGLTAWQALVDAGGIHEQNIATPSSSPSSSSSSFSSSSFSSSFSSSSSSVPCKRVFINGGGGGLGLFGIQLMKHFGAHVAVTSGPAALEAV